MQRNMVSMVLEKSGTHFWSTLWSKLNIIEIQVSTKTSTQPTSKYIGIIFLKYILHKSRIANDQKDMCSRDNIITKGESPYSD